MPKTSHLLSLVSCSLVISGLAGCTSSPPIQESHAVSSVASVSSASSALQEQSPKPISMTSSLEEVPVTENLTLDPG